MAHFHAAMREAEARGAVVEAPHPKLVELLEKHRTEKKGDPVNWDRVGSAFLRSSVKPHQKEAVDYVVEILGGRALVSLPTGTGKSLVSATIAAHYGGSVLIVASAQDQWRDEFEMWTEYEDFAIINGSEGELAEVTISTYKSVGLREDIQSRKWTTVIVDESHKLGGDCDTNSAVVRVCEKARCVLMVSATPMKGRPREMFNSFRCVLPKLFTNRKFYEKRYCDGKIGRFGYEARGATNTEELATLIEYLSVTCDKESVLPDLPPISHEDVRLDMPTEVLDEFREFQSKFDELTKQAEQAPEHLRKMIKLKRDALSMKMYTRTGEVKAPFCIEWLLGFLRSQKDPTEKVLVFAHNVSLIEETCAALRRAGIGYVSIDGETPPKKRHAMLRGFRNPTDATTRVAVLSLGTSAESLNLTTACHVAMFQMSFTPAQNEQAYARAWRMGQTRPVRVYRMIANGTNDDTVLKIHTAKDRTTDKLFKRRRTNHA